MRFDLLTYLSTPRYHVSCRRYCGFHLRRIRTCNAPPSHAYFKSDMLVMSLLIQAIKDGLVIIYNDINIKRHNTSKSEFSGKEYIGR